MEIIRPGTTIDFTGKRRQFGIASIVLVLISIVLLIVPGPNYGIDFKGGTNILIRFDGETDTGEIADVMTELGFEDAVVQRFGTEDEHQFMVQTHRISVITPEQAEQVREALAAVFGDDLSFEYDEDSGDRIEVLLPSDAFDDLEPGTENPAEDVEEDIEEDVVPVPIPLLFDEPPVDSPGPDETVDEVAPTDDSEEAPPEEVVDVETEVLPPADGAQQSDEGQPTAPDDAEDVDSDQDNDDIPDPSENLEEDSEQEQLNEDESAEDASALPERREAPEERYLREVLEGAGLTHPTVEFIGNTRHNRFLIRLQQLKSHFEDGLEARFGDHFLGVDRVETVGPRVGEQLRNQGIQAVILALFFILIYIAVRFNMRFAPGAVVALFHDVIITLGVFVILREEITLTTLAAVLTIVGYSLNDTIVVFDRIRENMGTLRTKDLTAIVNQSINECLSRTLLTSITTMIAVLSIFVLGGGLIKSFALALMIGVVVGTYSSIFVASPVMILVQNWADQRNAKQRGGSKRPAKAPGR